MTSLSKGPNWRRYRRLIFVPASLALALLVWELVVHTWSPPPFILPSPGMVWDRFTQVVVDGSLLRHTLVTLSEVMLGLAAGVCVATALGYILAKWPAVERLLSPYVVASQSVPIVAIAPLLVIWFGPGMQSKVLICALIVFFPVLVNTVVGLHSVPEDLRDLMRSLKATRWQTFRLLEAPAALPVFLGGLRIGATLAVIGAVVGEFVSGRRGLGAMVSIAKANFDVELMFVGLAWLVMLGLAYYGAAGGISWLVARRRR